MKYSKVGSWILRTLAVALVLVMPWANAMAADVADWDALVSAYNGWQNNLTLTADIQATSVLQMNDWRETTVNLNGFTLTPPEGEKSAFKPGSQGSKLIFTVSTVEEFECAAADASATTIKLLAPVTLTSPIVLANAQTIDQTGGSLTLESGVTLSAEASTYAGLKAALANTSITSVKLSADIQVTENCTIDLADVDLNGHTVAPQNNQQITMVVYNEAELTAALDMQVSSIQLGASISLTSDVVSAKAHVIDLNGKTLSGNVTAQVGSYDVLKRALNSSAVDKIQLTGNITVNEQTTLDLSKIDLNGNNITLQSNNVTVQVSNEEELLRALAMNAASIELKNTITITSDIESDKLALINSNGYSITGAELIALVDTTAELNAALANSSITRVKLVGNIQVDNGFMLNDLSRIDFNGYTVAPRQNDWTMNVAVTNEAELMQALAMDGAVAVLQNDIALSSDLVLENINRVKSNGYGFTGGQVIAEVGKYADFKAAMNSDVIDVVRLAKDIPVEGWDTFDNIAKLDLNGYTITGNTQLTFNVRTQEELALALSIPATNKAMLQNNIRLTDKIECTSLNRVDLNNKTLSRAENGGLVVGVTQENDITNALEKDYVYGVKLLNDITVGKQINVDSLDQIDENGYTLSFSGNGKVALNVSNEQELRAALADPDVKYINMTNDIRLRQDLTITAGSAQVITNGYKLTGAKVTCNVDSWEALKAACALGLPGAEITLTGDITQGEGSVNITADTTINLHNQKIETSSETVFNIQSGKLKITDKVTNGMGWGAGARPMQDFTYRDDDTFCKTANINNDGFWGARQLSYYVTTSQIVASGGYANAGTQETRVKYNYGGGLIDARDAEKPIFNVGYNGELEITGGAYFGSKNRAIFANGNVTLSGDTIFANNSAGDGGAVYMNSGKLTIKERRQDGNIWENDVHGVVFTGNHTEGEPSNGYASSDKKNEYGTSGGAIFIHGNAKMEMNGGYVTNNWCEAKNGDPGWTGGGGIAVLGDLTINGGYITANKAIGGGGIKTMINNEWNDGGAVQMNGGIVAGNLATTYEGGGIVVNHSGYGKITGGYITNNETATKQHWGGGGIFISDYGYMDMESVFVINNEAGGYGGGVAGCSTGRIDTHDTSDNIAHSTAIFENTALGKNVSGSESTKDVDRVYAFNDPVFNRDDGAHYQDYFCALSSYICGGMLGNGTANWSGTVDGMPIYRDTIDKDDVIIGVSITGLTSHSSQADRNNALKVAKVFVSGNESYTHGGGVLCNGYLVIGREHHATIGDRLAVFGKKIAEGFDLKAGQFGFYLIQDIDGNGQPNEMYFTDLDVEKYGMPFMTTGTNNADGLVEFAHRIPFADDGSFDYLIGEMPGNMEGVSFDEALYRMTVKVRRDVVTVVDTSDGHKHDIIAEPKVVTFYRIDEVKLAKREAGSDSFGEAKMVFNENSGANNAVELSDLFSFINAKVKVEYVDIEVTKIWVDNDDQDGIRPEKITVQLLADGDPYGAPVELTGKGNEWTYKFEDLPKHVAGTQKEIKYTIEELGEIKGYTGEITGDAKTGYLITNTHETEDTSVSVEKKWVDNNDQDGIRPEKIIVQLLADGTASGEPVELSEVNEWKHTWADLPKKANGTEITYTVQEEAVEGYTGEITGDAKTGYLITNTHETEDTSVSVEKKWVDNNNQDGIRPEKITVQLLADGTASGEPVELSEANEWKHTWADLPKKAGGAEIAYTVEEEAVEGYTGEITGDAETGYLITNTHETEDTSVSVEKKWVDNNDQDGIRPEKIIVQLLADGTASGEPVELSEANEWKHTWANLPKKAGGAEIAYTVQEEAVEGYTGEITGDAENGYLITNTHETDDTSVSVEKKWVDNNNQDGIRPESITVQLLADGKVVEGKTATLSGTGNEWTYTFTNLPKKANGTDIVYTVEEVGETVGYTTAYSADTLTITNTHETENVAVAVEKVWEDSDNVAGLRARSIEVQLLADGLPVEGKTLTLSKDNSWKGSWTELDKYAAGKAIKYSVEEVSVPEGYTSKTEMTEPISGHFQVKITNTYEVGKTQVPVTKKWVDGNNVDGLRPRSITIQLVADGKPLEDKIAVMTGIGNDWTYTFTDLPKYAEGEEGKLIEYTVKELGEIVGYTTAYSDDELTITNTHEVYKRYSLVVEKFDENDPDKKLSGAKFAVYADSDCAELVDIITTGKDGKATLTNLLAGTYYLLETDAPAGYQLDKTLHEVQVGEDESKTVTVRMPNKAIVGSLTLSKTVVGDAGNNMSFEFDVELSISTGDKLAGAYSATLNGAATTVTFTETADGAKATVTLKGGENLTILGLRTGVSYRITERSSDFYTTWVDGKQTNVAAGEIGENTVSSVEFQNKLDLTTFMVKKEWTGLLEGEITPDITLTLFCNGEVYSNETPKPTAGGWYIYENLPTMVNGVKAVYTVEEKQLEGFTITYRNIEEYEAETGCAYNGGVIVNGRIPQTGDNGLPMLWMAMMLLAGLGMMSLKAYSRKRT